MPDVPARRQPAVPAKRREAWAVAAVVAVLVVFWGSPLLWPLAIAVVFAHECSHALMAVATGGTVASIELAWNQSGATWSTGGIPFLVLNAGYLGSLVSGIVLLKGAARPRGMCVTVGLVSGIVALGWMPWISFGFLWVMLYAAGLIAVGLRAPPWLAALLLRVYGVFSILYALGDIHADVFGAPAGAVTDATMLAELTGVPSVVWGVGWLIVGIGVIWRMGRRG